MGQKSDNDRWAAWCADFDEVEKELQTLFHTRWVFRTVTEMLQHSEVPQYVTVQNYLLRTYVTTICTAVRREADADERTTSLARCLRALVTCPHFATRTGYAAALTERLPDEAPAHLDRLVSEGFRLFAPGGGEFIEPDLVAVHLDRLAVAAAPIRKYTNQVIAHRERRGKEQVATVSFVQINAALDVLSDVARRYYRLRHPGMELLMFTPVTDLTFLNMFRQPWYREGFQVPETSDETSVKP